MLGIARSYGLLGFVSISIIVGAQDARGADCADVPREAVETARAYYSNNAQLIEHSQYSSRTKNPGKKIVINDYRVAGRGVMYILDSEGNCEQAFPVDYGKSGGGRPKPGCESESNRTPPGMHITAENIGGKKYPDPLGMGMVSCSGQESLARGVKVHAGKGDGRERSYGCAVLSKTNYETFLENVRGGSLIYNYFGDEKAEGQGCPQKGGADLKTARCEPESMANSIGSRGHSHAEEYGKKGKKSKLTSSPKSKPSKGSGSPPAPPAPPARGGGGRTIE